MMPEPVVTRDRGLAGLLAGALRWILGLIGRLAGAGFDQGQIDGAARSLVQDCKRMLAHRADFVVTDAADYPSVGLASYDATASALAALGLPVLGDVADAAFNRANPDRRAFYRMGRSPDGTVVWKYFTLCAAEAPGAPPTERRTLVFQSWMEDGRVLATARLDPPMVDLFPDPPDVQRQVLPAGTSDAALLKVHRDRIAAARASVRPAGDLPQILKRLLEEEKALARYREGLGVELYRTVVLNSQGEKGRVLADAIVRAIEAHPEWR